MRERSERVEVLVPRPVMVAIQAIQEAERAAGNVAYRADIAEALMWEGLAARERRDAG